jgi:hypothetical protein
MPSFGAQRGGTEEFWANGRRAMRVRGDEMNEMGRAEANPGAGLSGVILLKPTAITPPASIQQIAPILRLARVFMFSPLAKTRRALAAALLVSGLLLFGGAAAHSAPSIRVATCEVDGFPPPTPDAPASEEETKQLRMLAGNLKPLDAEIVVLHGLPDRQVAKRLSGMLKPGGYHVAFHGAFRQNGAGSPFIGPSISILTRRQPFAGRAMEWKATSQIDWPGGFAFVGLSQDTNAICIYVAHLPGEPASLSDRENPLLARRRDLAAQYLVHHANWMSAALSNQLVSVLVTGDFIADARGGRAEGAVRILQQAGFKMARPNSSAKAPAREDDGGEPPQLTALLARNAELISTAQITSKRAPFPHGLAAYEVAPMPTAGAPVPLAPRPAPAQVIALDSRIVWLWVGGIAALCVASLFSVWLIGRTFSAAGILARRGSSSLVLDVGPFRGQSDSVSLPPHGGESYSASTPDASGSQATLWQARAVQAEQRAKRVTELFGRGLRPQLNRLLGERLIAWLSFQRSALLQSHELGTRQVLELESRLHQVQGQFQERLRSREDRIADLERDIQTKERIIRDLLRAQARLASERAGELGS